jgi:[acyl-carrier-protein] S-malonyltransferase|tara:strand:- start:584 stop:1510 length:927 start_codon:yes stop_codon:yes gene_type:complete
MFSIVFPGQGSQIIGMGKEFYNKFDIVKNYFHEADEILKFSLSKLIFDGPKNELDLTINTQPAIFLVSYSIYKVITKEYKIDLDNAKYFAGHSLGEYSALSCAGYLNFSDTIKILRIRGEAMQNSVPKGEGGMLAVLGSNLETIEDIITKNEKNFNVQIANDNSDGQLVISAKKKDLELFKVSLNSSKIKNLDLPVSAPFHSSLMNKATSIMQNEINKLNFVNAKNKLISNVTAKEINDKEELKDLLIKQIENRVRWRESISFMIEKGVEQFIEIGPGKVLSGLIKRINREIKVSAINNETDIENISL